MNIDGVLLLLSIAVFAVYGFIFIMAIFFTFFLETYIKIEDMFKLHVVSSRIITPLEIDIDWFNHWALKHNKIVGVFLIALSLIDITMFLYMLPVFIL